MVPSLTFAVALAEGVEKPPESLLPLKQKMTCSNVRFAFH
jgi:hypothetical protein